MQRHDLRWIRGHGVDRRSAFDQQTGGFGLAEKAREVKGREAVFRAGVDSGGIAETLLQAIETAERGGLENIERFLRARDQFRQVAASTVD